MHEMEVPDVIRILKELVTRYTIRRYINYHFVCHVKIIFICLFIIILQTISYQISLCQPINLNYHNNV